jgi:hypothetical protein
MLRSSLALLACLERAPGPAGAAAALPKIFPLEPIKAPFPRAQRRSFEPGSPAQRAAATQRGRRAQQYPAHHSGEDQSRFPLERCSLSEGGSGSSANPPSVARLSISRLSRRVASLLVFSKIGGGRPSAEVLGFIVKFLRLRKVPIDAIEIFAMALAARASVKRKGTRQKG